MLAALIERGLAPEKLDELLGFADASHPHPEDREIARHHISSLNPRGFFEEACMGKIKSLDPLLRLAQAGNTRAQEMLAEIDLGRFEAFAASPEDHHLALQASLFGAKNARCFLEGSGFFEGMDPRQQRRLETLSHPVAMALACLHELAIQQPKWELRISEQLRTLRLRDYPALCEAFHQSPDVFHTLYGLMHKRGNTDFEGERSRCDLSTLSSRLKISAEFSKSLYMMHFEQRDERCLPLLASRVEQGDPHAAFLLLELARTEEAGALEALRSARLRKYIDSMKNPLDEDSTTLLFDYAHFGNPDALAWARRMNPVGYYATQALRRVSKFLMGRVKKRSER